MTDRPLDDPELEDGMHAAVDRGEFATVDDAPSDFRVKLDRSIAEIDAGLGTDAEIVFTRLQERYANWPRAAE